MNVLILGPNGFIGHRLVEKILSKSDWQVYGMDLASHRLENCLRYPQLHFTQGDLTKELAWIKEHLAICDVVLHLAAITSRTLYVQKPLKKLIDDFTANLEIVSLTHTANKRLIFPKYNGETCQRDLGPISQKYEIFSAFKQLLDRIIYIFGEQEGLNFTLFCPFNWIGPNQDNVFAASPEYSHIVSLFLSNLIHGQDLVLPNGGRQEISVTYIDDGIDALFKMIENRDDCANGRIFNIGNPANTISIKQLAEKIKNMAMIYPKYQVQVENAAIIYESDSALSYPEFEIGVPAIEDAAHYLEWYPKTDIDVALKNILDFYLV
jgi:nucleoside-diphosphate-sugar epimerase